MSNQLVMYEEEVRQINTICEVLHRDSNAKAVLVIGKDGQPIASALNILSFTPKKGARIIKKVLESAIANAEHNNGADIDELKVTTIYVEKGPVLKRFHARAKGRGNRIVKPTCHVFLTVGDGKKD